MASLAEFLQAQNQLANRPTAMDYAQKGFETMAMPSALRMKQLEEQKAFEDYANTQKLRELFAQSKGMPDIASVGQYSPEMAIKLQQAQLENLAKQAQIRESSVRTAKGEQEYEKEKGAIFANALGPYGDEYFRNVSSGMPAGQALYQFKAQIGAALRSLKERGIDPDAAFNFESLQPDQLLTTARSHGFQSTYLQQQQELGIERQKREMPPARTPKQEYGDVQMTPQGPMRIPPISGSPFQVMESGTEGMQQAPMGQQDIDNLKAMYQNAPPGPDKERLGAMLADAVNQTLPNQAGAGGFVTPEQAAQMRVEEERAKSVAKESAKAEVEQQEVRKQKAEVLSSLPKVPELNKLIDQSMSGKVEELVKGTVMGELGGIPSQALNATKELNVVANQMKQITKSLVGAGAVSDFEQRQMAEAAGNIADPATPAETRKQQLKMFNRIIRKTLEKTPQLAQQLNAEDSAIEEEPAEAPSVKRGSKPKIGQVESGYMFKGGNPADPANWEKQ